MWQGHHLKPGPHVDNYCDCGSEPNSKCKIMKEGVKNAGSTIFTPLGAKIVKGSTHYYSDLRYLLDGSTQNYYCTGQTVEIMFNFGRPVDVASYELFSNDDQSNRDPKSWVLLGSNNPEAASDDPDWVVLDKVEGKEPSGRVVSYGRRKLKSPAEIAAEKAFSESLRATVPVPQGMAIYHTGRKATASMGMLFPGLEAFGKDDRIGLTFNASTGKVSVFKNGCLQNVLYEAAPFAEPMHLVVSTFGSGHRVFVNVAGDPSLYQRDFQAYAAFHQAKGDMPCPAELTVASALFDDEDGVAPPKPAANALRVCTMPVPKRSYVLAQAKASAAPASVDVVAPIGKGSAMSVRAAVHDESTYVTFCQVSYCVF
jgi:hypothetical protein